MLKTYRKLLDLLTPQERRRTGILLVMILLMGMIESTRVASVLPFVAVLSQPDLVKTNHYLAAVYDWFGFQSINQFLVALGLGLFAIIVINTCCSALTTWATARFTAMRTLTLTDRLLTGYLARPYEWFLTSHSADLGNAVLSEVNAVVGSALMPAVQFLIQGVIAGSIILLLLIADPVLALIVTTILAGLYYLVFAFSRAYLGRAGTGRRLAGQDRFRIIGEAFGGIKDVKVMGLERTFLRRFAKPSRRLAKYQSMLDLLNNLPQYGMQIIAFAVVLVIVFYQMSVRANLSQALPIIALYAVAGSRLTPALNSIYQSASRLTYAAPALDELHRDLVTEPVNTAEIKRRSANAAPLGLKERLELREIVYRYPTASAEALRRVSLTIPARGAIGLVGKTGAGKTTLVDIILGLLEPAAGELVIDGTPVTDANRRAWQRSLGYVPQHIFLADDTVAGNIAFGIAADDIDMAAVENAARIANLHDFVTNELESGYATPIGERGIRLSGGQRQRVGIARALYGDPDLLIMDEGTSALDNVTERAVMDAVNNLARRKTIILIAHRLTTVRRCETIFMLDHGNLVASGSYEALAANDVHFRAMVESAAG